MPWLRERRADAGRFSRRDNAEVAQCGGSGDFQAAGTEGRNGAAYGGPCGVPKGGNRDQGAANAVPEEPKDCRRKGILCGYMLATSGANIVCVPEAGLKSLKIRR